MKEEERPVQDQGNTTFTVDYEYQGRRSANQIQKNFYQQFVLPAWIEPSPKEYKHNLKCKENLDKMWIQEGKKKESFKVRVTIVDRRTLKYADKENQYKFVLEDERQLNILSQLKKQGEAFKKQIGGSMGDQEKKQWQNTYKYVEVVDDTVRKWQTFKSNFSKTIENFQKNFSLPSSKTKQWQVTYFSITIENTDQPKQEYKKYYYLLTHRLAQAPQTKATIYNYIISGQGCAEYPIVTQINFKPDQPLSYESRLVYYKIPQNRNVKVLKIEISIKGMNEFFHKQNMERGRPENYCWFADQEFMIQPIATRNRIVVYDQEPKLKRNMFPMQKHFHLAFQGGGAKGLAYVGAYKAIKQYRQKNHQNIQIPIKSIMGSSAGGIIALAISTGIPQYELQKICYQMNDIPSKDRITEETPGGKKNAAQKIKQMLDQYGIIQPGVLKKIGQYFSGSYLEVLEEKILIYLEAVQPALAPILKLEKEPYPINNDNGCMSRLKGWMFGRGQSKAKRSSINLAGLLEHGSVMKGQVIHDIAAQCIIKYMLKEKFTKKDGRLDEESFCEYLRFFNKNRRQNDETTKDPKQVWKKLNSVTGQGWKLLNLNMQELLEFFHNEQDAYNKATDKEALPWWSEKKGDKIEYKGKKIRLFQMFITGLLNRFLLLVDNYLSLGDKPGLYIYSRGSQVNISFLQKPELMQYFTFASQDQIPKKTFQSASQELKGMRQVTYKQLNALFNRQHLIDPIHISIQKLFEKYKNTSIVGLMSDVFKDLGHLNLQAVFVKHHQVQIDELFYSLEAAETIKDMYVEICKIIKKNQQMKPYPQDEEQNAEYNVPFEKYMKNMVQLEHLVSKITLKQYYNINGIQLSFTSVDLDDKILRFFNQKTAPDLPVCRAVQMTGSFPVAFKAQRWKKQWGYYSVHTAKQKIQIDLEGHQFTDGGFLANFPIKYMDNKDMRAKYFSHKSVKGLTCLLGFGLDALDSSRYELTQKQKNADKQSKEKAKIAFADLKASIKIMWTGIQFLKVTRSSGSEDVKWSQLSSQIFQQIPLFRFLIKLLNGYPNSDRNLNLQAFSNRVLNQDLYQKWLPYGQNWEKSLTKKRFFLKQLLISLNSKNELESNRNGETNIEDGDSGNRLTGQQMQKNSSTNVAILKKDALVQVIKNKRKQLQERVSLFVDGYSKMMNNSILTEKNEAKMSQLLINILILNLKMKQNRKLAEKYSQCNAYIKYIAHDHGQNLEQLNTDEDLDITPTVNKNIFKSIFDSKQLILVNQHHDMYGYQGSFYQKYQKCQQQFINEHKNCCFQYLDQMPCSCCCCHFCCCEPCREPNREKQLREQLYDERMMQENRSIYGKLAEKGEGQKQYLFSEFRQNQRQEGIKQVSGLYRNSPLCNMQIYDVTDNFRRMTQFLYIFIKGRQNGGDRLKSKQTLSFLTKTVKSVNFQILLSEQIQKIPELRGQADKLGITNLRLSYHQILMFFNREHNKFDARSIIETRLKTYLEESTKKQNILNRPNNTSTIRDNRPFYREYIEIWLKIKSQNEGGEKIKQHADYKSWEQRQFQFTLKHEHLEDLLELIKAQIISHRQLYIDLLVQILFNRQPILSKGESPQWIETPAKDRLSGDEINIKKEQMQKLLKFIVTEEGEEDSKEKTLEQSQKQVRDRIEALHSIYHLIANNYKLAQLMLSASPLISIMKECKNAWEQFGSTKNNIINKKFKEDKSYPGTVHVKLDDRNYSKNVYTFVDENSIKLTQVFTIQKYLNSKLKQRSEQPGEKVSSKKLIMLNNSYFSDMHLLLQSIKQMEFMSINLNSLDRKQCPTIEAIFNFITYFLKGVDLNQIQGTDFDYPLKQPTLSSLLNWIHHKIFAEFVQNYIKLANLPLNQINQSSLSQAFIIRFRYNQQLIYKVYKTVKSIHLLLKSKPKLRTDQPHAKKASHIVRYILNIFSKLSRHKFSLPLMEIDWDMCKQFINPTINEKTRFIVDHQEKPAQLNSNKNENGMKVHLIFEGTNNSNEYMGGLYENISIALIDRMKSSQWADQPISVITTSNFQSIFGFLLSLQKPPQQIRIQMFKLQYLANVTGDQHKITSYFDKFQWVNKTPQNCNEYLNYMKKEHVNFFDKMTKLTLKDYNNNSLESQFNNMRLIYMDEQDELMSTYDKIIDKTSSGIGKIQGNFSPHEYALEISKKYGIDYVCEMGHRHQYSKYAKESIDMFKFIANKLFTTFGSLMQGIICNQMASNSFLDVNKNNASFITKAVLTNKLLSVFKLKEYIHEKLKEKGISPGISLKQFYNVAPRQILLNFTVININQKILTFLNKNTAPNMPLWAAILATSSLPTLHSFFEADKEWEIVDSASFYDFFIYDFFKAFQDNDKRITKYTSGNALSSIPLEYLLNDKIQNELFRDQKKNQLIEFTISFSKSQEPSVVDIDYKKRYLNLTLCGDLCFVLKQSIIPDKCRGLARSLRHVFCCACCLCKCCTCECLGHHDNDKYVIGYSPFSAIGDFMSEGPFTTILNTLLESSDNFTLRYYYDQVIRLPIKVGTLDFHLIVEQSILKRYGISLPSEKSSSSIQKSYEVTKSFIHNVTGRNEKSEEKCQDSQRFLMKIRVDIIDKSDSLTAFSKKYYKLNFINHSKWNQNSYNNFLLQYWIDDRQSQQPERYTRIEESEVLWSVEKSSSIYLKIYYPEKKQGTSKVMLEKYQLNFSELMKNIPVRNSYDYEFKFSIPNDKRTISLEPTKRNGMKLREDWQNRNEPKLKLTAIVDPVRKTKQFAKQNNSDRQAIEIKQQEEHKRKQKEQNNKS